MTLYQRSPALVMAYPVPPKYTVALSSPAGGLTRRATRKPPCLAWLSERSMAAGAGVGSGVGVGLGVGEGVGSGVGVRLAVGLGDGDGVGSASPPEQAAATRN